MAVNSDKWRWRAEIAFGVAPRSELKSWEARYQVGGATKALSGRKVGAWEHSQGGTVQLGATKAYKGNVPVVPAFDWRYTSDYSPDNATKSFGGVSLRSDGMSLYAAEERVISIKDAGMSPNFLPLVRLTTVSGKSFVVEKDALQPR